MQIYRRHECLNLVYTCVKKNWVETPTETISGIQQHSIQIPQQGGTLSTQLSTIPFVQCSSGHLRSDIPSDCIPVFYRARRLIYCQSNQYDIHIHKLQNMILFGYIFCLRYRYQSSNCCAWVLNLVPVLVRTSTYQAGKLYWINSI